MMNSYKHLIILFMALLSCNSMAGVYKCKQPDGKVTFQDKQCPEEAEAQVILTGQAKKLCYSLNSSDGKTVEAQNFWTEKHTTGNLFFAQINKKKTAFLAEQIESINVIEQQKDCVMTRLINSERQSFDATICDDIHYSTDKGEETLTVSKLAAIQNCQSKTHADGDWTVNGKKYPIQSAYVSYSKSANQLKVTLFPFMLSKSEEEGLLKGGSVDSILSGKPGNLALGMIFKLRENVTDPQIGDVMQFQTFVANSQATSVRSYDQNWRQALNLKQLHIIKSKQSNTAQIGWVLTDRDQQATINISAIVAGDKF